MDNLDGSDHYSKTVDEPAPSLLTIILDTNPSAWSLLSSTLPFSTALAHLLVFINAHLACNNSNTICIIAAHPQRAEFLYPSPSTPETPSQNGHKDHNTDTANSYGPFHHIQTTLLNSLTRLLATTPATTSPSVALSGALTLALAYTNRHLTASSSSTNPTTTGATNHSYSTHENPPSLHARILLLSLSSSLSAQYIPLTNTIFACQRLSIPIDIARLTPPAPPPTTTSSTTSNTTSSSSNPTPAPPPFLQQASDATSGTYLPINHPTGLLQYLMLAFLPDAPTRLKLHNPGEQGVDFRAACFCHRRVVSVGFVCSVCLSIFCEPPTGGLGGEAVGGGPRVRSGEGGTQGERGWQAVFCLTCSTPLKMGHYGLNPVVLSRKKKKRRKDRLDNGDTGGTSGAATPVR